MRWFLVVAETTDDFSEDNWIAFGLTDDIQRKLSELSVVAKLSKCIVEPCAIHVYAASIDMPVCLYREFDANGIAAGSPYVAVDVLPVDDVAAPIDVTNSTVVDVGADGFSLIANHKGNEYFVDYLLPVQLCGGGQCPS